MLSGQRPSSGSHRYGQLCAHINPSWLCPGWIFSLRLKFIPLPLYCQVLRKVINKLINRLLISLLMDFVIWTNCLGNQTSKKPPDSFAFETLLKIMESHNFRDGAGRSFISCSKQSPLPSPLGTAEVFAATGPVPALWHKLLILQSPLL